MADSIFWLVGNDVIGILIVTYRRVFILFDFDKTSQFEILNWANKHIDAVISNNFLNVCRGINEKNKSFRAISWIFVSLFYVDFINLNYVPSANGELRLSFEIQWRPFVGQQNSDNTPDFGGLICLYYI